MKEKNTAIASTNQDLNTKLNYLRQELVKYEDYSSHQKNLLENNKKEYDHLKSKVKLKFVFFFFIFFKKFKDINEVFLTQRTDLSKVKEEKSAYEEHLKIQEQKTKECEKLSEDLMKKNEMIMNMSNDVIKIYNS